MVQLELTIMYMKRVGKDHGLGLILCHQQGGHLLLQIQILTDLHHDFNNLLHLILNSIDHLHHSHHLHQDKGHRLGWVYRRKFAFHFYLFQDRGLKSDKLYFLVPY